MCRACNLDLPQFFLSMDPNGSFHIPADLYSNNDILAVIVVTIGQSPVISGLWLCPQAAPSASDLNHLVWMSTRTVLDETVFRPVCLPSLDPDGHVHVCIAGRDSLRLIIVSGSFQEHIINLDRLLYVPQKPECHRLMMMVHRYENLMQVWQYRRFDDWEKILWTLCISVPNDVKEISIDGIVVEADDTISPRCFCIYKL